MKDFWLEIEDC